MKPNRRSILGMMPLALAAAGKPRPAAPIPRALRDRLWLWCHAAGSHNTGWGISTPSRITPVEAAFYMGIPNAIFVRYEGSPEPPFDQYALPFASLREVVWSVVGAAGETGAAEREAVIALARRNANFSGVMMDDFFEVRREGKFAALTVAELGELQGKLKSGGKPLDLWVVLYDRQLRPEMKPYLEQCDGITFWTWKAAELANVRENFERLEKLAPRARKLLGCYMYDYGARQPMSVAAMESQCEQGREWLRQGRIEGMIFLASCICDLKLEAVEWTRRWIAENGGRKARG
ncbi:MAG: hypothetical protein FJW37_05635 [Acidobacteria bacterium]|nr:hypothetical protein [Acidobacteriota bacterium]